MARTVLSLALLACLGLAFLHLVSADEQNRELEEKAINGAAIQENTEEHQVRTLREADADAKKKKGATGRNKKNCPPGRNGKECRNNRKRKGRSNKKRSKKCKKDKKGKKCLRKKSRSGKNGSNKGKSGGSRQRKKPKRRPRKGKKKCKKGEKGCNKRTRKNGKKHQTKNAGDKANTEGRQAACDTEALCQKIKDYIKYSNQLRKLRRINKTCSTMEKKRDKAGGGEFSASGEANDASDNSTVQEIADKLKNCTSTAKAKCETKAIPACTNLTLNNKCETELDAWIKKFGPAKGSCLQASASCCACITAISPAPSSDCLNFDPLDIASKAKKKKCTGSSEEGSFGHCRKLQMEAAEKGPKAHKEKCKGKGDMTTAKSSGRRNIFRSNLMKKFIKT